jgi:hypothetical protein
VNVVSAAIALGLALAHVLAGQLRFVHMSPRSAWLSFAGGVAVAFVFLELLPALHRVHQAMGDVFFPYALALAGLAAFYAMEIAARRFRKERGRADAVARRLFVVHIGAFAAYNAVIGSLVVDRVDMEPMRQGTFFLALGVHLIVNDLALREHHEDDYARFGRWVLAAAVLAGWVGSELIDAPAALHSGAVAVVAGAIILNVLKEELPPDRDSRFGAFTAGCVIFAALLLIAGR